MRASKGKENVSSVDKGKGKTSEFVAFQAAPNYDIEPTNTLGQTARRELEKYEECTARQLAQRKQRDRDRLGECIKPRQVRRRHMDTVTSEKDVPAPNEANVME